MVVCTHTIRTASFEDTVRSDRCTSPTSLAPFLTRRDLGGFLRRILQVIEQTEKGEKSNIEREAFSPDISLWRGVRTHLNDM